jgi:DNA polymerase-3 subunit delta
MMASRRAVVVRELERLPEKELLLGYLEHPSPTTLLVLATGKPDFRTTFFRTLEEQAVLVECRQLYDNEVPGWIRRRVEAAGKKITEEACELMPASVGKSLRDIQQEIDKLLTFAGERSTLTAEDVSSVVGVSKQYNVFELQNALGARDLSRALSILESMMRSGEQPTGIVVMLTKYLQRLLVIRAHAQGGKDREEIGAAMRIAPRQLHFFRQDVEAAHRFTPGELEDGFAALADADEQLKSTSMDPKLVMTLLLYALLRAEERVAGAS